MHKLLICLVIITFSSVLANSVLARGEKSEIRFDIPSQSTGNNVRRASSEITKSFSSSGYGFEYIFSTGDLQNDDIIIDFGPIKFLIDKISIPYIEGSTIIWVKDGLNEYFKYDNPKEKSSCGCGVSVQF